jgi:hypothetical protein
MKEPYLQRKAFDERLYALDLKTRSELATSTSSKRETVPIVVRLRDERDLRSEILVKKRDAKIER